MQLTLMSYNIKSGVWTDGGLEAVARMIEQVAPDIVTLQEVDQAMERTDRVDQTAWLGQRLGMHAVFAPAVPGEAFGTMGGNYGIAMLSRWPIVEDETRLLYFNPSAVELYPEGYIVEQRVILGCSIAVNQTTVDVFCTHFDLLQDQRIHQADDVVAFCSSWHANKSVVLMGDFNAEPDSPEIATIRTALRDVFEQQQVQGAERMTFPGGPLGSRTDDGWAGAIDHVFVSQHFEILGVEVIREAMPASDHAPVVARVRLDG